ncbi:MAG: hypothetical protein KKD33_09860 [Verrucomicrobia bacterium]|nr:hypothetical protein [Verrucomicrobiota bacterium]
MTTEERVKGKNDSRMETSKMNTEKKRLIVLWIGIGLVVLALLFPPHYDRDYYYMPITFGYIFGKSLDNRMPIDRYRLHVEVLIVVLLTAGALYTIKKTDGK